MPESSATSLHDSRTGSCGTKEDVHGKDYLVEARDIDPLFSAESGLVSGHEVSQERNGLTDAEKDAGRARGVFEGLLGQWSFVRKISGQVLMTGDASFTVVDGETALYEEAGEITLGNGQRLHAKQSYIYKKREGGFAVLFRETQDLFHEVAFGVGQGVELRGEASHLCRQDHYVSHYTISPDGGFEVSHRVYGPRKDYSIRTVYRRRVP